VALHSRQIDVTTAFTTHTYVHRAREGPLSMSFPSRAGLR
jgi:hypothetical protein